MTTDAQLAPTDDEIHAVVQACRERGLREFDVFRAVLAKLGTPTAGEPVAWLNPWRADQVTTDYDAYGERGIPLYTAPQPAPAPLSDAVEHYLEAQDALDNREYGGINAEPYEKLLRRRNTSRTDLDAALAAQGGKDA